MREEELKIYRTSANNGIRVDYDYFYQQSRLHTNWANPETDIHNKVFFLNQFRCRLPYAITDELLPVLERVSPLFAQVQNIEIQDLNEGEEIYPIITEIFDTLRNHVNRFRETASGKFMHMTCPNLFTMIDSVIEGHMQHNGIIHHHFTSSEDYTRLLEYYRNEINELIEDIMQTHGVDRLEAINRIRERDIYAESSILRIIDKHFYWLATH
jgi:predicted house-cleaning noncanonical NTP pyrophosphatase (MazG superfamily)